MRIDGWDPYNRNNLVQEEKAGTDMGFAMPDNPLDHLVPYPTTSHYYLTVSGNYQYLYRENKTHVVSSEDTSCYHWHWQNWPCHWFCNSSRLWLTRHSNKHAVTILTREGAGAAVTKEGACEMWAAGAGGNSTHQPRKRHFWGALNATQGPLPPTTMKPARVYAAPALHQRRVTHGIDRYSVCRGSLTVPQEGLCNHHPRAGHTEGTWRKMSRGFISFILSFPLLSPHPCGTGRHRGRLIERVIKRLSMQLRGKWKRAIHNARQFLAEKH